MDTLNEIFLACVNEELNISVAFQMAYDLGKADAQRELAEELTGGSSILRDPAGDVSKEGEQ